MVDRFDGIERGMAGRAAMAIYPLSETNLADFTRLMGASSSSDHCRCMWFIKPVRKFHDDGAAGNGRDFDDLARRDGQPLGLLAYDGSDPVGWCACGPRARYLRALGMPTFRGRDPAEDETVWLIPCLFVHPRARGQRLTVELVRQAVAMATAAGARAVEAFPHAVRAGADPQVGVARIFEQAVFRVIRRPSASRVVVRRDL